MGLGNFDPSVDFGALWTFMRSPSGWMCFWTYSTEGLLDQEALEVKKHNEEDLVTPTAMPMSTTSCSL